MISRKKKSNIGIIVSKDGADADVFDNPGEGSPKLCQIKPGRKVKVLSRPNKDFVGIEVTHAVVGFVLKKNIKVE